MRTADGETEVPPQTYQHFADRDPLEQMPGVGRPLAGEYLSATDPWFGERAPCVIEQRPPVRGEVKPHPRR